MKNTLLIFICIIALNSIFILDSNGQETGNVITCTEFHITKPLRELVKLNPYVEKDFGGIESKDRENRIPQTFLFSPADGTIYGNDPLYMQTTMGTRKIEGKTPIQNWAGQTTTGLRPFDPSGAAGPNHYIQMINCTNFKIFNKTGTVLLTASLGSLWTPPTANDGDPIVLYDKYADRWFLSQFGQSGNKIYIAISTSPDPTGSYYTYTFTSPQFPDYLKFSIWENGYYMTSNQSTDKVFCFERSQMLLGNASSRAISATFSTGGVSAFFCPLPADADGGLPPAGTPLPFFANHDNAWGGGNDGVNIWNMTVTWGTTPTATITAATLIETVAFDASYDSWWDDIIQPGTSQKLDGIGGVLLYRAQWRKWATYNSVVLNWGVKINATQRSIMWVELRQDIGTGAWSVYQQQIYTPDTDSRWMGSIAMDDNGSIALCYAKSSSTVYPSLCYTGRLASDPPGTMSFTEVLAIAGDKVQTNGNRFGDYSQTSLDPDGITFWHTGEYIAGSNNAVKTRIYSFQLPIPLTAGISIALTSGTNPSCDGSPLTFTATPTNGGTAPTYQWKVNGNNAGTNDSVFTISTLTNGQIITCEMTSNLPGVTGNPVTSNAINITINPIPATPSISRNDMVLTSSSTNGNQWYLDGNIISGATGQSYTCIENGEYTVVVTIGGCSSDPSAPVIINVGINEKNNIFGLSIFPNPNNGKFSISFNANVNSNYNIEIIDASGKQVFAEFIKGLNGVYSTKINLANFGKGNYTITLTDSKNKTIKKIAIL